jgi:hypothetical protein
MSDLALLAWPACSGLGRKSRTDRTNNASLVWFKGGCWLQHTLHLLSPKAQRLVRAPVVGAYRVGSYRVSETGSIIPCARIMNVRGCRAQQGQDRPFRKNLAPSTGWQPRKPLCRSLTPISACSERSRPLLTPRRGYLLPTAEKAEIEPWSDTPYSWTPRRPVSKCWRCNMTEG